MRVIVTGSKGFIGKNLCIFLKENDHEVIEIHKDSSQKDIENSMLNADFIFHLAGSNRPKNNQEFDIINSGFTKNITSLVKNLNLSIPIVLASSTQAEGHSDYGKSKKKAEEIVQNYSKSTGAPNYIYRLPNVFGKWCKPNYNSFIATFCHNILNNIHVDIHDPKAEVSLLYIDDLCESFLNILENQPEQYGIQPLSNSYNTTVGEVAEILISFKSFNESLISQKVGTGLIRALYSTYLSFKTPADFSYSIQKHEDERGVFCEMLKTKDSGQFSFFTAHPGVTRGSHYHHTKNEKFLVVKGSALFKFENIDTAERFEITTNDSNPEIVETVPGWSHSITNVGKDKLFVILWANEIFDQAKPDTFAKKLFEVL